MQNLEKKAEDMSSMNGQLQVHTHIFECISVCIGEPDKHGDEVINVN